MRTLSDTFMERWYSGDHIANKRPHQRVRIRKGHFQHERGPWAEPLVDAEIPNETRAKPWQGYWVPTTDWVELPSVLEVQLGTDFGQKGMTTATIGIENVIYTEHTGHLGYLYHLRDRGALSPYRGYTPPGRPDDPAQRNDWFEILAKNSQIMVEQGYGEDEIVPVFTGLIDNVDPQSIPDRIVLTLRDFGQALVDQPPYGKIIGPEIREPLIFTPPKPNKENNPREGDPRGRAGGSSSHRKGHPPRLATDDKDGSGKTAWLSVSRDAPDNTEWVQIKVPRGKYGSILLHPKWKGMTAYISVFAKDNMLGGDKPEIDGEEVNEGWITAEEAGLEAPENDGLVPGSVHGGIPYILKIDKLLERDNYIDLKNWLKLGSGSIIRVSFRNLHRVSNDNYRAGVTKFKAMRRIGTKYSRKRVGQDAHASSHHANFTAKHVLDKKVKKTKWISSHRTSANVTEWVEIEVPQGEYGSFRLWPYYRSANMYVGVYAMPRKRKRKNGKVEIVPARVDGKKLPNTDPQWIDLRDAPWSESGPDYGTTPGDTNGGWPYLKFVGNIEKPYKPEKYLLNHIFNLGPGSKIRLGFRNLHKVDGGTTAGDQDPRYRMGVGYLKAVARLPTGKGQEEGRDKDQKNEKSMKVQVTDLSDIVRVALRWAGFKEWIVEDTGAHLTEDWTFGRSNKLIDLIDKVSEVTGFTFFIMPPLDNDNSIGMPVFRQSQVLRQDLGPILMRDRDLVTSVSGKLTDEPLRTIIRVRGKVSKKKGVRLGEDRTKRIMGTYVPTWTKSGRMSGIYKPQILWEKRLVSKLQCEIFARLVALRQALESATVTFTIPGAPFIDLDDQLGLIDTSTGFNSRVYTAQLQSVFQAGENASWFTTIGGSLLDTPDVVGVREDLIRKVPHGDVAGVTGLFYGVPPE